MLNYDIRINGEVVKTNNEQFVFTLDKSLDSGKFLIPNSDREEIYNTYDEVTIIIDDDNEIKEWDFYVQSDRSTTVNASQTKFKHEITLIERTKRFDEYVVEKRTFLQPATGTRKTIYNFADNVRLTIPYELDSKVNSTRLFEFGSSWNQTQDIDATELITDKLTLRELMNRFADQVSGVIRVRRKATSILSPTTYPHNILEIDYINETKSLVDRKLNISGFESLQDMREYITTMDIESQNIINSASVIGGLIFEPNDSEFGGLRSDDGQFPQDSAYYRSRFKKFQTFHVKMKVPTVTLGEQIIDITLNVFEQDALPVEYSATTPTLYEGFYQSNSLIWNFQENKIINWYTLFDNIGITPGQTEVVVHVIKSGLTRLLGDSTQAENEYVSQSFDELEIQIAYKGFYDARFQMDRIDSDDINKNTTRIANQSDSITDSVKIAHSQFVLLQTIGNEKFSTTGKTTSDLSKIVDVGDYSSDGYIITKVELNFFRGKYIPRYEWTKNYQRQDEEIGIDSKPELYEKPSTERTIKRNLYYKEFLKATFNFETQDSESSLTDQGLATFMNTFRPTTDLNDDTPPFHILFRDDDIVIYKDSDGVNVPLGSTQAITIPIVSWGTDNALHFYFEFTSPNIAGQQITRIDTSRLSQKPVLRAVQYTDGIGELDTFTVNYVNDYAFSGKDNLPITVASPAFNTIFNPSAFKMLKGSGDIIAKTLGLHVIPEFEDEIILGRKGLERNNLVEKFTVEKDLFLIRGSGTYDRFENQLGKIGHISGGPYTVNSNGLITVSSLADDSWALVDSNNNLYLAVNQRRKDGSFILRNAVYFIRQRKRDDILDVY
jgi:hypothetical protein